MSRSGGGRQNCFNFGTKKQLRFEFKIRMAVIFPRIFFYFAESDAGNKSRGNNYKFIADRHANVKDFFRQAVSSTFCRNIKSIE